MTKQEIRNNISTILELGKELKEEGYSELEIIEITHSRLKELMEEIK